MHSGAARAASSLADGQRRVAAGADAAAQRQREGKPFASSRIALFSLPAFQELVGTVSWHGAAIAASSGALVVDF